MNHNNSYTLTSTSTLPTTHFAHDLGSDQHRHFLISMIVVNVAIAIVASFFNFLIILTFLKNTPLRTPSNVLLFGLAITDLFAAILSEPSFCVVLGTKLTATDFLLYRMADRMWIALVSVLSYISFYNVIFITADRFLAVRLHLRYHQLVTSQRYCGVLVSIWLFGTLVGLTDIFLESEVFNYVNVSLVVSGLILNFGFIFKIAQVIRRHSAQIRALQQSTEPTMNMPRYKKSVNTMYFVVVSFVLCYGPQALHIVIDSELFTIVCHTLLMLNGVLNPVIYCWRIKEIRNAVFRI